MIPLKDVSRRPAHFPVVTVSLIAINAIVFALELSGGDDFILRWSMVPAQITSGHHLITLLTAMFMHAGWLHILGNMLYLWVFGPTVEDGMGSGRYLVFYLLGGLVANLAQIAIAPHSTVSCLGASGAIAAVMGAFIVTYPGDRIRTVVFLGIFVTVTYISALVLIGLWFALQFVDALSVLHTAQVQSGGTAFMAHVGGFIFGAILGHFLEKPERIAEQDAVSPQF
ncbi:MAG TPA: rhomboid family intramembrane serine protease [Chthonomonadaceae bacterium]|nr:rhomboid family intramembrane serine protease [Chthonomonadaceae bacterium]